MELRFLMAATQFTRSQPADKQMTGPTLQLRSHLMPELVGGIISWNESLPACEEARKEKKEREKIDSFISL